MVAFYRSAMKTLRLQLSELDDDFFLLSQGEEGEMHEVAQEEGEMHEMAHEGEMRQTEQGNAGKRHVNRTNFVIKCLEVGPVSVRFT